MNKSSFDLFTNMRESEHPNNMFPPIIIADNLRTPENMGMILRLAGNFGAALTLFLLYDEYSFRESKIKRTSSGAYKKVDWKIIKSENLSDYIPDNYNIIALETCEDSQSIFSYKFPNKTAIIVGNEVVGIRDSILKYAKEKVFIPIPGKISSLNVSHSLSIALFQWLKQFS